MDKAIIDEDANVADSTYRLLNSDDSLPNKSSLITKVAALASKDNNDIEEQGHGGKQSSATNNNNNGQNNDNENNKSISPQQQEKLLSQKSKIYNSTDMTSDDNQTTTSTSPFPLLLLDATATTIDNSTKNATTSEIPPITTATTDNNNNTHGNIDNNNNNKNLDSLGKQDILDELQNVKSQLLKTTQQLESLQKQHEQDLVSVQNELALARSTLTPQTNLLKVLTSCGLSRWTMFSDTWHENHPNAAMELFGFKTWQETKNYCRDRFAPDLIRYEARRGPSFTFSNKHGLQCGDVTEFEKCLTIKLMERTGLTNARVALLFGCHIRTISSWRSVWCPKWNIFPQDNNSIHAIEAKRRKLEQQQQQQVEERSKNKSNNRNTNDNNNNNGIDNEGRNNKNNNARQLGNNTNQFSQNPARSRKRKTT